MTVCLARFRSKGSLIICEIRNIDHVRVYHGISFIQSKTTISIMLDLSLLLNNGCLIQPLSEKVIIILPRFSPIIKNR